MRPETRVAVNSIAQYLRTIFNIILGFYTTNLVLAALGESDYGIYALIGSVTSFLMVICNALTSTTQRYLSFHQANSGIEKLQSLFYQSFIIQLFLGIVAGVILEIIGLFLFDGFLNISYDRIYAAKVVFHCSVLMVLITLITSPFRALLVAHENLVYISVVEVLDSILKLICAILIAHINFDKLINYAILITVIWGVNLIAYCLFSIIKYPEARIPKLKRIDRGIVKNMSAFAGWTLYGMGCTLGRIQGLALVLNTFFGTIMNAALGIAMQVNSATQMVSSSLLNAINPQIIKSEGEGNHSRMLALSQTASKMSFFLIGLIAVPIIFNTRELLTFWLGNYPNWTVVIIHVMLLSAIADSLTTGLGTSIQAIGKLKVYTMVVYTTKLLTLPVIYVLLKCGLSFNNAIWAYFWLELLSAILRLPMVARCTKLNILNYLKDILCAFLPPLMVYGFVELVLCNIYRDDIVVVGEVAVATALIYILMVYFVGLNPAERQALKRIFSSFQSKFAKH